VSQQIKVPWIIKYRPKKVEDVINQEDAKSKILEWLKKWPSVTKKALLLYGPPGCGKTSLVEAIANDLGFELLEMNASDFRRKEDIERIAVRASTVQSLFASGKKKLILLDEVDGVANKEDVGGLEAIELLIKVTKVPVIMTANNPWDQKLRALRDLAEFVQFKKLEKRDLMKLMQRICNAENLLCEAEALEYIIMRAEGDARAAINDLQAVGEGFGEVTLERAKLLLRPRDKEKDPFETLKSLFSSRYAWQARNVLSQSQLDYEQLKLWLEENIPYQYTDIEDIFRAYEALSKADIYLSRIVKSGDWDLLAYATDLMSAGVALAAINNPRDKDKWTKYSFPQRISTMVKFKEARSIREDLASILAKHLHISTSTAKSDVLPILKAIFVSNPEYAAKIALGLGLSEKMIEMLAGPNKQLVLNYYKRFEGLLKKKAVEALAEAKALKQELKKEKPEGEKGKKEAKDIFSFTKK
jgi:replication factor C large subunit